MSGDVINLGNRINNGSMKSPEDVLQEAIDDIGNFGALKEGKKLLVLSLDDNDGQYAVSFQQAGMKMSECLVLCEIAKGIFREEMGYN